MGKTGSCGFILTNKIYKKISKGDFVESNKQNPEVRAYSNPERVYAKK